MINDLISYFGSSSALPWLPDLLAGVIIIMCLTLSFNFLASFFNFLFRR